MKIFFKWMGIILLVFAAILVSLYLIYLQPFVQKMSVTNVEQLDPHFRVITGGGGNSAIISSDSLLLLIDTKMDEAALRLADTVKRLQGNKALLVINTHWHPDHVGGNYLYPSNTILAGGSYGSESWKKEAGEKTLPGQWLVKEQRVSLGNDTATIINLAKNVHTPSDIFIYLHQRKVLFAGDVILNQQAPVIMAGADGDAYMEAIKSIKARFQINWVVPGHGAIGGPEVIDAFYVFLGDMKTAAAEPTMEAQLLEKYKDWNQIPFLMSPKALVRHFRSKEK